MRRFVRRWRNVLIGRSDATVTRPGEQSADGVEPETRHRLAAAIRMRGPARRALIVYSLAALLLFGQQPLRAMSHGTYAKEHFGDLTEFPVAAVRLSLWLDLLMIALMLVGGLSAATALWHTSAALDIPGDVPPVVEHRNAVVRFFRRVRSRAARVVHSVRTRIKVHVVRAVAAWLGLLCLTAAVLDLLEDTILLARSDGSLSVTVLTPIVVLSGFVAAAVALLAALFAWRRQAAIRAALPPGEFPAESELGPPAPTAPPAPAPPSAGRPNPTVACSGGGLRSASFSLGALQELQAQGLFDHATPTYAVSGGSYMASSFVSLWQGPDERAHAFKPGSPEEHRLRNNTRFIAPDGPTMLWAAISLLWGVVVNVVFAVMLLRLITLVVGMWWRQYGVLDQLATEPEPDAVTPGWSEFTYHAIWVIPLALAAACIVTYFGLDTFFRPFRGRNLLRLGARVGIITGLLGLLFLVAAPEGTAALARMAQQNQPNATVATVISGLGFPKPTGCEAALRLSFRNATDKAVRAQDKKGRSFGGCGETGTVYARDAAKANGSNEELDSAIDKLLGNEGVSQHRLPSQFATFAAFIVAIAGLAKSASGAVGRPKAPSAPLPPQRLGRLVRRARLGLSSRIRRTVLPWLATALVVTVTAVLLLRWMRDIAVIEPATAFNAGWQLGFPIAVLGMLSIVTNANRTSMHTFYREQLSTAFAVRRTGDVVEPRTYNEPWQLSSIPDPINLTVCAAVSCNQAGVVPPGRECTSLTFTRDTIGMTDPRLPGGLDARRADTTQYEAFNPRSVTVPAAVAISGAAISPVTGRQTRSKPFRLLLAIANVRLGVWLRNPALFEGAEPPSFLSRLWHAYANAPHIWLVFREAFGRTNIDDRWLYATDGGHYENLALVEALRSRPERLIVLDASGDGINQFAAIGTAVATARMDLDVEINFYPDQMVSDDEGYAPTAVTHAIARWRSDGFHTHLYIGKLILTSELPWDAKSYALQHPEYPVLTTGQQLYGEFDFEAYRVLGRSVGHQLASRITSGSPHDRPSPL